MRRKDRVLEDIVGNAGQDTYTGKGQDHVECDPHGLGDEDGFTRRKRNGLERKLKGQKKR
jgi:hypothetical protein